MKLKKKKKLANYEPKESWASKFDISQETKNSIWGLLSFLVVVISILAFVGKAGTAGTMLNSASRALFGWGFFLIPIAFGLLSFAFIKSISRKIYTSAILGTSVFVLASLAVFFILGNGEFEERLVQGGYLGVVFGYPLRNLLGFTASFIILVALMVMSVLLALNVPLYQLVTKSEEERKGVDNIVIKQGNESLRKGDIKPAMSKAQPAKVDTSDMAFVIRNLKMGKWTLPPLDLLNDDKESPSTGDINASAMIIKRTLSNFGIDVEMGEVSIGPTVTQYTLRPAVGVKLSRISTLNPDLSLALAAHPIRIEAPIPGKSLVGIEVPNKKIATVSLRALLEQDDFTQSKNFLPLVLGRDVSGSPVYTGLEKMPHLLIAGATGTGKSVMINSILLSLLYKHSPDILKFILVDPKRVELTLYNEIPHLIAPVITDNKKVLSALRWAISEMDHRYDLLSKAAARDVFSYNARLSSKNEALMPFIVIVIDELADLMSSFGRDVEAAIVRLAQMSRAVGIHLILSTQRPSVEVITGLIKANITSRIALQVASQVDSRTILDMSGAEKLLGRGDMLFVSGDASKPRRLQAPLTTEKEVKDVVEFIRKQAGKLEMGSGEEGLKVDLDTPGNISGMVDYSGGADDDLYEDAKAVVVSAGKASASLLQRRLRVGYARAARLLDILEENGVIGPGDGAKPREVYVQQQNPVAQVIGGETGISADTTEAEREEV